LYRAKQHDMYWVSVCLYCAKQHDMHWVSVCLYRAKQHDMYWVSVCIMQNNMTCTGSVFVSCKTTWRTGAVFVTCKITWHILRQCLFVSCKQLEIYCVSVCFYLAKQHDMYWDNFWVVQNNMTYWDSVYLYHPKQHGI